MGNAYVRVCWCLISGRYKSIDTFRCSIKIDSNRSKSSIIYRLKSNGRAFVIIDFIDFNRKMSKTKICDYRFLSIIISNQSTNIECYRVIMINQLRF